MIEKMATHVPAEYRQGRDIMHREEKQVWEAQDVKSPREKEPTGKSFEIMRNGSRFEELTKVSRGKGFQKEKISGDSL